MLFPVSAGTHSCPDYLCCHSVIFPTLSVVCFLPGNGDKRLQGLLYFLLSHNVFFPYFVVYGVPGNGDKQLQGPFYFLLSHNVFFPYFVVYFLPGNGDIQLQGLLREHADLEALH